MCVCAVCACELEIQAYRATVLSEILEILERAK